MIISDARRAAARVLLLITLAGLVAPRWASAEGVSPEVKRQVKAHAKQANAYFEAALYDRAIQEYEAAFALDPHPPFLFNIAQCHRKKDEKAQAIETYQRFLALVVDGPQATEARTYVAQLTRQLDDQAAADAAQKAFVKRQKEEQAAKEAALAKQAATAPATFVTPQNASGTVPSLSSDQLNAIDDARAANPPLPEAPPTQPKLDLVVHNSPEMSTTPVYKRWWLWTVVGVLAAGGVALAIVFTTPNDAAIPATGLGDHTIVLH